MEAVMQEDNLSLAKRVRAMFRQLEKQRQPYEPDYETIAKYIFYRREFFPLKGEQGKSIARTKYDSTASDALNNLVHGFQGYMVSRSIGWLDLEFENKKMKENKEAQVWLMDIVQYLYEVFKGTNFYDTVNDNLADAVAFGTPCLYSENDKEKGQIIYSERHPIEIYITENRYGAVDTVFREYKMSSREIAKQFPHDRVSNRVVLEAGRPEAMYNEHIIIHACFPNEDVRPGSKQSKDKKFKSVYIEKDAQFEDKALSEKGYDQNPYVVWRWNKNSTEWYGRSPSHDALPEILTSNQLEKAVLEATELTVNPAKYAPASHRGRLKWYPGGINYYENYEAERMEAINPGIQLPVTLEERQSIWEKIKQHYFNDFFLILSQYFKAQKTATEVMEIQGEKAAIIAPIIGRYESRFLDPIIERTFHIEDQEGRLPEMPPVLQDLSEEARERGESEKINVKYIGPLATIQEKLFKTTGTQQTLAMAGPIVQLQLSGAPVLDNLDFDEILKDGARDNGASPTHIRGEKDVKKIREDRAKLVQAQQQMEVAQGVADAVPKLGKKEDKGSVLDEARSG